MFLPGSSIVYCFILYSSFGPGLILVLVVLVILNMANIFFFHICYFSCVLTKIFSFDTVKCKFKNPNRFFMEHSPISLFKELVYIDKMILPRIKTSVNERAKDMSRQFFKDEKKSSDELLSCSGHK